MKIGYARVSTQDQSLKEQIDALQVAGCEKIYSEKASGLKGDQLELEAALKALNNGDTLVVWSLDRVGKTTLRLLKMIEGLNEKNIGFEIVTQKIDTSSIMGKAFLLFAAMFAESESKIIGERTRTGLLSRKARGGHLGNNPKLKPPQVKQLYELYSNPKRTQTINELAKLFGISKKTVYNYVNPIAAKEREERRNLEPTLFPDAPIHSFGNLDFDENDLSLEDHK